MSGRFEMVIRAWQRIHSSAANMHQRVLCASVARRWLAVLISLSVNALSSAQDDPPTVPPPPVLQAAENPFAAGVPRLADVPADDEPPVGTPVLDSSPRLSRAILENPELIAVPSDSNDEFCEPLREDDFDESEFAFRDFGYRGAGHPGSGAWLIGNGNHMGLFTLDFEHNPNIKLGEHQLNFDLAIHWVMGPKQTDMPPRLYDFLFRWNHRRQLNDCWGYDLSFTLGFYADFEGSARKGLRWPSTAVLYYRTEESLQWLLGIDILNRDDLFCLPVAGAVWTPTPNVRAEFVFPKPRIAYRTARLGWAYVAAEMWGSMWAIERATGQDDVVTYRDYRIMLGLQGETDGDAIWFTQLGVAYNRHLDYRSGQGDFDPRPVFLLNSTILY